MLLVLKSLQLMMLLIFSSANVLLADNQPNANFSLNITDLHVLNLLNDSQFSFKDQMSSRSNSSPNILDDPLYRSLLSHIERDIEEQRVQDSSIFPDFPSRIDRFKIEWLKSKNLIFSLAAIVNRFDRRGLPSSPCGETRLVYRPGYPLYFGDTTRVEHLPMTISLIYSHQAANHSTAGCRDIALKMKIPSDLKGQQQAEHFLSKKSLGHSIASGAKQFERLELNIQISRWPTIGDESFSDQSHYLLRRLAPNASRTDLAIEKLENTPDVKLLTQSQTLYEEFKKWIMSQRVDGLYALEKIQVPERFLASKAISVSPFSLSRLSNRPFSMIFGEDESFDKKSLRTLDSITCSGCHQSHGVAGFHALGGHTKNIGLPLTLSHPFSAYFEGVQFWRKSDLLAYLNEEAPPEIPVPERIGGGRAGDSCDLSLSKSSWTCAKGFYCDAKFTTDATAQIGECVIRDPTLVGRACDATRIVSSEFPLQDKYLKGPAESCGWNTVCAPSRTGFPGGFCTGFCNGGKGSVCARVPELGPFSACVTATKLYRECATIHSVQVDMPVCKTNRDCRRDYACVYVSDDKQFCAPPYFLPDLTLEHHEP